MFNKLIADVNRLIDGQPTEFFMGFDDQLRYVFRYKGCTYRVHKLSIFINRLSNPLVKKASASRYTGKRYNIK